MKSLIQRVSAASVTVDNEVISEIGSGCLILLGVEKQDSHDTANKLAKKISQFRFFNDQAGKMNLDIRQHGGEILVVSQFTLVADTQRGNRPGFSKGASPEQGRVLYHAFMDALSALSIPVQAGRFGADMKVTLVNDGPVTFNIDC
ncbi:D-tyrosyl-tRNA(Tyr) deacylase [Alteromonas sediminis]|uniref:D-aminoacyl-tRNA deacylase n=1 Tax=Alteromonas sediminis TaxID=2259342 RepID=A0A3N5YJK5_9ALTE|nr:D-aminoacyl-tRNA deacylase [Alteromonas sediminis]RPJ64821.1 D-tyrosyl-tRNA(Tyr) deacylase [Alteromonas sediminis]